VYLFKLPDDLAPVALTTHRTQVLKKLGTLTNLSFYPHKNNVGRYVVYEVKTTLDDYTGAAHKLTPRIFHQQYAYVWYDRRDDADLINAESVEDDGTGSEYESDDSDMELDESDREQEEAPVDKDRWSPRLHVEKKDGQNQRTFEAEMSEDAVLLAGTGISPYVSFGEGFADFPISTNRIIIQQNVARLTSIVDTIIPDMVMTIDENRRWIITVPDRMLAACLTNTKRFVAKLPPNMASSVLSEDRHVTVTWGANVDLIQINNAMMQHRFELFTKVFGQLRTIVATLHSLGRTHRNITPSNIFVDRSEQMQLELRNMQLAIMPASLSSCYQRQPSTRHQWPPYAASVSGFTYRVDKADIEANDRWGVVSSILHLLRDMNVQDAALDVPVLLATRALKARRDRRAVLDDMYASIKELLSPFIRERQDVLPALWSYVEKNDMTAFAQ
jgi:hypothetical protein